MLELHDTDRPIILKVLKSAFADAQQVVNFVAAIPLSESVRGEIRSSDRDTAVTSLFEASKAANELHIVLCGLSKLHTQRDDIRRLIGTLAQRPGWDWAEDMDALQFAELQRERPGLAVPGALPPVWNVPHRRNPNFTGREQLLTDIHAALTSGRPTAVVQAIYGQGGVGKTGIAVEYAYRRAADCNAVCWLNAASPATLAGNFAALSRELRLPGVDETDQPAVIQAVRIWFERNGRWLLVFDNALAPADLEPFLPRGSTGHVLITSRSPDWGAIAEPVAVPVWPRPDSISYLLNRTKDTDAGAADKLALELGDLPLAVAQAAGYVVSKKRSLADYLDLFRTRRQELWKRETPPHDYEKTVATTWNLALQQLPLPAVDLLSLFAFLGPESIPRSLVSENAGCLEAPLAAIAADPLHYDDCLQVLLGYSLIEATETAILVHRILQMVVRDRLADSEKRRWLGFALRLVNASLSIDKEDPRPTQKTLSLVPHALAVLRHAELAEIVPEPAEQLANKVGIYYKNHANYSEARRLIQQAIAIDEKAYADDYPTLAARYSTLATVEQDLGNHLEARQLLRKAIAIVEKMSVGDDPVLATMYSNLALVEKDLGNLPEARRLMLQAIEIAEKAYAAADPTLATMYSNLALVERDLGNLPEASRLLLKAIAIDKKAYAVDHPRQATSYSNLALVEQALRNFPEARRLLLQVIAIGKKVYGADHPRLAPTYANLAVVEQELKHLPEARGLLLKAIAIEEKTYVANHPTLAASYWNLALLEQDLDNISEARRLMRKAHSIWSARIGDKYASTQRAAEWLLQNDPEFRAGHEGKSG